MARRPATHRQVDLVHINVTPRLVAHMYAKRSGGEHLCAPLLYRFRMHERPPHAPQDVAEGIAREARLMLFEPRVLAMDAYPVTGLPAEAAVVFVASTTGQVRFYGRCRLPLHRMQPHAAAACAISHMHAAHRPHARTPNAHRAIRPTTCAASGASCCARAWRPTASPPRATRSSGWGIRRTSSSMCAWCAHGVRMVCAWVCAWVWVWVSVVRDGLGARSGWADECVRAREGAAGAQVGTRSAQRHTALLVLNRPDSQLRRSWTGGWRRWGPALWLSAALVMIRCGGGVV